MNINGLIISAFRLAKTFAWVPVRAAALLLWPVSLLATQFDYTVDNGIATITGYHGSIFEVQIPEMIDGLPVKRIGDYATLGNGTTGVTIPASVTNIGFLAFASCARLVMIEVDPDNAFFSSLDGVLFNKDQSALVGFPPGRRGDYSIPRGVITVGKGAFSPAVFLTGVTIPEGVTTIEEAAFTLCGFENIQIPDTVQSIGNYAFASCLGLTTVTIPLSVTRIGYAPFRHCTLLTSISVDGDNPAYVSRNGVLFNRDQTLLIQCPNALQNAYVIPAEVTQIGDHAFNNCRNLVSVTIPAGVTNIGTGAFILCTSLRSVNIPSGVSLIPESAFWNCTSLLNVTIPNTVTRIDSSAFAFCDLVTVTIPPSVTRMGGAVFDSCAGLGAVYFAGDAPVLDAPIFSEGMNATVYYLPGTTGWDVTFFGIPTAPWFRPDPVILNSRHPFGIHPDGFGFKVSWATNALVIVEVCTNMAKPTWMPVSTNMTSGGAFSFRDSAWTNSPSRMYRLRSSD